MLVELERAVFGYAGRPVVRVEQLRLRPGRCLGVFGPNGSGKTTLVRGLTGLLSPMSGTVRRRGDRVRFGYLPQHRAMDSHWPMTGFDAAAMAVSARRRFGWLGSASADVWDSLRKFDVIDLARRRFSQLSGGQQQRLLLAGALAARPEVLVLDEPTDGLDVRARQSLLDLLQQEKQAGLCIVVISHQLQDLRVLAEETALLAIPEHPAQPSEVEFLATKTLADRML